MPATFNRTTSQDKTGWKSSWHVGGRILCAVVLVTRVHGKKMGDRIFSFRVG